jgi:hypothetical protein
MLSFGWGAAAPCKRGWAPSIVRHAGQPRATAACPCLWSRALHQRTGTRRRSRNSMPGQRTGAVSGRSAVRHDTARNPPLRRPHVVHL